MPTYYDPMTLDDLDITPCANFYLIHLNKNTHNLAGNTYAIKGVSTGLQRFLNDPHTHATHYWLLDVNVLLQNQQHAQTKLSVFPDNKLTTQSLSLEDVK